MAFLNRIFRNRGLLENLGREPLAPTLEPIRPRPIVTPFVPPQPVLPFPERLPDPFERLPIEDPRDDFLSIQRLDDRPPAASPLKQAFERIQNQQLPVLLPPKQQGLSPVAPVNTGPIKLFGQTLSQEDSDRIRAGGSLRDAFKKLIPEISDEERAKLPSAFGPPVIAPILEDAIGKESGAPDVFRPKLGGSDFLPRQEVVPIRPSIGGIGGINQDPRPLERPIIPPRRDDFMSIERLPSQLAPPPQMDTNDSDRFSRDVRPIIPEPTVTNIEGVIEPAPTTPAAVATDVGAVPVTTIPEDIRGQVDPVLTQQDTRELQTDPLLRALYFGTADQPGFINQLQQATANLIGSDVPLQGTAGLSDLEQMAQDRALADLGVAEPFVGESADLIRGTTRQFDPSMTQQFFNPFEDQVVQQTIQDVLEAGEKRDIQQRARDIQTGGLSAFGSRARLTAADRQEALGRGLAEALGSIRQAGFGQAQRDAITTFAQQRQAEQQAARDIGQVGTTLADLRAGERRGLAGFGQTGRDIEETALSRLFKQQTDQQGRPLTALQLTGQLLPQFQAGSTQIDSEYRLPADPSALGLGAAFSAYSSLKPPGTT